MLKFPTQYHEEVATSVAEYADRLDGVDTVLVVNSCARGQAVPESDLDMAILMIPPVDEKALEAEWLVHKSSDVNLKKFCNRSPFSAIHLDFFDGSFTSAVWDDGGGPDDFEIEIGNRIAYASPLIQSGPRLPESFTHNELELIGLKTQIKVLEVQIDMQKQLLSFQSVEASRLEAIIMAPHPTQSVVVNVDSRADARALSHALAFEVTYLPQVLDEIEQDLLELESIAKEPLHVTSLHRAIDQVREELSQESVMTSGLLDRIGEVLRQIQSARDSTSEGIKSIRRLGRSYNKIAEWCGLPQIPSVFLD